MERASGKGGKELMERVEAEPEVLEKEEKRRMETHLWVPPFRRRKELNDRSRGLWGVLGHLWGVCGRFVNSLLLTSREQNTLWISAFLPVK